MGWFIALGTPVEQYRVEEAVKRYQWFERNSIIPTIP
jgi:hypothetical protein